MRLCHINLARTYRGGERQTELLIRELAARNIDQRLVVRREHELATRCSDVDALEIVECASNPLAAGLAARGATLVHAHEARAVYAAWIARRVYGIPYLLTRRVTRPQKRRWLRDRAYRSAGALVAVSRAVAENIAGRYPDAAIEVIPDAHADFPVDAAIVTALRERYARKTLIGHLGSYDHSAKGQLTIIDVAGRAATVHPDWHFLLLGAGPDEALFRERIKELTNIELVGFVDNVGDYLSAFDVFVFPSLHEALGSSVLDAMHFGLPIVATRVGGIPEFVEDGVNGILITRESADELMAGIERVRADETLSREMAIANRAKAGRYGAGSMATAYEALYDRLR